ncbi:MAG: efflux RND transporter permease subunit, partial [Nitratireductor sp.]|nr:efflux RND transporter permease subunit [Nitratireductor sp.]
KEAPEYAEVYLGYDTTKAQLFVEVDRTRAADLGVDITGMGEALRAVLDGSRVGTVFRGDKSFDIKLLSSALAVNDPGDLERILVRTASGEMIPVSSFVRLEERAVAPELRREGQMRAVPIDAELGPDTSLNRAYAEALGLAREVLPERYGVVPLGQAKTLEESGSALFITFGFAILIVLLVLAAQFESFVSAFVIMITVPVGLACAVFALLITGGSLNVYSQIGLILLVGIMAKNGILIVEFANQLRDEGMSVRAAIEQASIVRLRPVMMTMIATVLGGVPLVLASGAGAEAREVLGWIIVGGLGMATIATLYLTPVAYLLLAGLSKPRAEEGAQLGRELREASSPREMA